MATYRRYPKTAKPVTLWKNRDEAFRDIAQGIRKVIEESFTQRPDQPSSPGNNLSSPQHPGNIANPNNAGAGSAAVQAKDETVKAATGAVSETDTNETPPVTRSHQISGMVKKLKPSRLDIKIWVALIGAIVALTTAYWQFVYKSADSKSNETVEYTGRVIDLNEIIRPAKASREIFGSMPRRMEPGVVLTFTPILHSRR